MRIARVIPLLRLPRGLHFFDYAIPESIQNLAVGALVRIPFRSQKIDGVVIGIEKKKTSSFQLKNILAVRAEALLPSYWEPFTRAIEQDIGATLPTTLRSFLAIGKRAREASFRQLFPQMGSRYDALRIGKSSLGAIERVARKPRGIHLFIWHTNEERIVAYLKYIEQIVKKGSALVLFPQWSEAESFLQYLPKKYAGTTIAIHSALSQKERRSMWQRVATEKKRLVVGTRFALFVPFQDLAGIILDHEHFYGWKEEQNPRYDTRRYVEILQNILRIPLLFSSPSPTIERRFLLRDATIETPSPAHPETIITDLRDSFSTDHPYITATLREAIARCTPDDRIVLFHNRTGYGSSLACTDCGMVATCTQCSLPFTHHKDEKGNDLLRCHHCLKTTTVPLTCPSCLGTHLTVRGKGNERITEEIRRLFPTYTHCAVQTYPALAPLLWESKEKRIALIAFIDALSPLSIPDFKTVDDLFALLTIARTIARAHGAPIILQTFSSEHPIFDTASFPTYELEERKKMRYPPFTRLVKCIAKDAKSDSAKKRLEELSFADVTASAVFPSHPPKRGTYYYWYRLLRLSPQQSLAPIIKKLPTTILIDVDPETLL